MKSYKGSTNILIAFIPLLFGRLINFKIIQSNFSANVVNQMVLYGKLFSVIIGVPLLLTGFYLFLNDEG